MSTLIRDEPVTVGATRTFQCTFLGDGDLPIPNFGSFAVTVTFTDPNGNQFTFNGVVVNGPGAIAQYTNLTGLFNIRGAWQRQWMAQLGATVLPSTPVTFLVR